MSVERCPCFTLGLAHRRVQRFFEEALSPLGLTVAQAHVLHALFSQDQRQAKDLARELQVDAATLTPMLDRLERLGLVRRCPDPQDRRATRICLEERAHRLRPAVETTLSGATERLVSLYAPDEFATLMRLIQRLNLERLPPLAPVLSSETTISPAESNLERTL
ncbi:MAG: MarR family transcriptional regulator [Candidatus Sericytochromatia bacterium]|nr:MarR family transcriptional regulator [Candidatus Sericytochromatia bacterium]